MPSGSMIYTKKKHLWRKEVETSTKVSWLLTEMRRSRRNSKKSLMIKGNLFMMEWSPCSKGELLYDRVNWESAVDDRLFLVWQKNKGKRIEQQRGKVKPGNWMSFPLSYIWFLSRRFFCYKSLRCNVIAIVVIKVVVML